MKIKNALLALAHALLLAGCQVQPPSPQPDQCMRAELFAKCMAALPPGPEMPHYNDWDEVVEACEDTAYYQSQRPIEVIKPECRAY